MQITIKRIHKTDEAIDGQLFITTCTEHGRSESLRLCDTAENALSAIPAGKYNVSIIKCNYYKRKMPVILMRQNEDITESRCKNCISSECFTYNSSPHKRGGRGSLLFCPQIKAGNGVYHREDGSIIVGECIVPGCLKHTKAAFDTLYERMRKTIERGNEVALTITEDYPEPQSSELSNYQLGQILVGEQSRTIKHF